MCPVPGSSSVVRERRAYRAAVASTGSVAGKCDVVLAEVLVEEGEETAQVERLGQVVGGAGLAEVADLTLGRIRRQDDDGDARRARIGAEALEDDFAGKIREVAVQQDEVGMVLARRAPGRATPAVRSGAGSRDGAGGGAR